MVNIIIQRAKRKQDNLRIKILNELGFKVIRFTNEEVIGNIENTINSIIEHLTKKNIIVESSLPLEGPRKRLFLHIFSNDSN